MDIVNSIKKQIKKYGVEIPLFTVLFRNNTNNENIKYILDLESHETSLKAIFFSNNGFNNSPEPTLNEFTFTSLYRISADFLENGVHK